MSETSVLTIRLRLRDRHASELNRQARAVNTVWNYCNETQQKAVNARREWLTAIDLQRLTAGSSKLLDIHAHTIQRVCHQYDRSRSAKRRPWLRFRGRKSLGWVPFNTGHVSVAEPKKVTFRGAIYETMHWRDLPEGTRIKAGSFSQDARGRWYINMPVDMPALKAAPDQPVGIDLGLKDIATLSTGDKIENHKHYRRLERRLGVAQRAKKRKQVKRVHAKIKNARTDQLHKASASIAARHNIIVVGDVSPSKLTKTRMAKSVLDAGWSTFKTQLQYKAMRHDGTCIEVSEAFSTQVCSSCWALPPERPKGIADLGIREWECSACGELHDRDVNAARNILRLGLETLAEGATP